MADLQASTVLTASTQLPLVDDPGGGGSTVPDLSLPFNMVVHGTRGTFTIKRGDTWPHFRFQLQSADPASNTGFIPIPLGEAEKVELKMRSPSVLVATGPVEILQASRGECVYEWETDDLGTAGTYNVEAEITWGDGTVTTVPNGSYVTVRVVDDLPPA